MPNVKAYEVTMLAASFTSGGRSFAKGFKAKVPETNPEVAFFKQHSRIFKMKETVMTFPDKAQEKATTDADAVESKAPASSKQKGKGK